MKEIKSEGFFLLCPKFSSDGNFISAVGHRLKNGEFKNSQETDKGYYLFDLKSKKVKLLKQFASTKREEFWFGAFLGYGNHIDWN